MTTSRARVRLGGSMPPAGAMGAERFVPWALVPPTKGRVLEPRPGWDVKIYVLIDAQDDKVRYVGVTAGALEERLSGHIANPTNSFMRAWLASAPRPRICLLTHAPSRYWADVEMEWIAWFRARGHLLNRDPGGRFRSKEGKPRKAMKRVAGMIGYQLETERKEGAPYFREALPAKQWRKTKKGKWLPKEQPQKKPKTLAEKLAEASRRQMDGHTARMNSPGSAEESRMGAALADGQGRHRLGP